ncbi:hypothetical protein P3X46_018346 [Hevea brasiliensis]|uniref:U-box domain-containing protein n=1 Tax=Hevea brasiliensis TaxID=3981 RepID=A0ABQ9LQF2_HEVBR|nr:U-box domain-containing protein 26-like [Hevea brasiliensis]KAJ9170222.1 hypothetical protein P3X46_018346 [Hevea brasiliensis]
MKEAQMSIPHLFICPISLDLFKDPVTLCTGQTYDRSSIEKWLSAGNLTCPVTMQKLHDLSMVPNHTLRHLIDEWLQMGPQFDPDYKKTIDSLSLLKSNLASHEATLEKKFQVLERIQALSEESTSRISYLLQLGFLPSLLELVFGREEYKLSQENIKFAEQTLSCVLKLVSMGKRESLNMLKKETKLESFKVLLEKGTSIIQVSLCHLIEVISSSLETIELCAMPGKNRQLLQGLLLLVQQNCGTSEAGIKAVYALCSLESNREKLVQEDVINRLLIYISNAERRQRNLAPKAIETIELLLGLESAKEAVINNPNGVSALVKMVFRVSDHEGSESAVRSLVLICSDSLQAREQAICVGVLTQLLLLLQSQCSGRTKSKARMLLKLLRSKQNEDPKHF